MNEDIKKYVEECAAAYAAKCFREEKADTMAQAEPEITGYMNLIREGLERYRGEPPESNIRKYIDILLKQHGTFAESDRDKKRHNAIVLKHIISRPMSGKEIEKRLGIAEKDLKRQIEEGIKELAHIMAGDIFY